MELAKIITLNLIVIKLQTVDHSKTRDPDKSNGCMMYGSGYGRRLFKNPPKVRSVFEVVVLLVPLMYVF
jgi:hypothetical protein